MQALKSGLVAERMAVAATVAGDHQEARFWAHLPVTLAGVKAMQEAIAAATTAEKRTSGLRGGSGLGPRPSGLSVAGNSATASSATGGFGSRFSGQGSALSLRSDFLGGDLPGVRENLEEASISSSLSPFLAEGSELWTGQNEDEEFDDEYGVDLGVDADAYDRLVEQALEKAAEGMGPQAPLRIGSRTRRQSVVWRGLLPGHVRVMPTTSVGGLAAQNTSGIRQVATGGHGCMFATVGTISAVMQDYKGCWVVGQIKADTVGTESGVDLACELWQSNAAGAGTCDIHAN